MSKRNQYTVCWPREYTVGQGRDEETRTDWVRVGAAFDLKDVPGLSLEIHVPLVLKAGARLVLFVKNDETEPEQPRTRGRR